MKQKLLTLIFIAFIPMTMMADDCQVGGIYYNLENATLYVPFSTKESYEAADDWKKFGNIVEMEESCLPITFADSFRR